MPASSYLLFLAGVFVTFLPAGLLTDIPALGANSAGRLVFSTLLSGLIAVAYVVVVRMRRRLILPLIVIHVLLFSQFERIAGPKGARSTAKRFARGWSPMSTAASRHSRWGSCCCRS